MRLYYDYPKSHIFYSFKGDDFLKFLGYEIKVKKIRESKPAIKPKLELDHDLIKKLKNEGISNREIARRLNVSENTIRRRLKELLPE
jgi:DNA invertase Pin-like site-specific DNA recombinase